MKVVEPLPPWRFAPLTTSPRPLVYHQLISAPHFRSQLPAFAPSFRSQLPAPSPEAPNPRFQPTTPHFQTHLTSQYSLIRTVNRDVQARVLVDIAECESRVNNELFGLEACVLVTVSGIRSLRPANRSSSTCCRAASSGAASFSAGQHQLS